MTSRHEALSSLGLSDEQIDAAIARSEARYVDPHDLPPGAPRPGDVTIGGAFPADLPVREQQLDDETAGSPVSPPPEPVCPMSPGEVFMSLNGFDEIAVANYFGAPVAELRHDPVTLGRALAFIHERRRGRPDKEAYAAAMDLTIHTVSHEYFAKEPAPSAEGNAPSA